MFKIFYAVAPVPATEPVFFAVRVPATGPVFLRLELVQATGLPVTPLITTYQDTAERSPGTLWYNGNGQRVVMVGALVRILIAVHMVFFLLFFDET